MLTKHEVIYENMSFPNSWAKAVHAVMRDGREIVFGGRVFGKEDQIERKVAKELDTTIIIEGNAIKDILKGELHPQFPTKGNVRDAYVKEFERGYNWKAQGFTYSYGGRCEAYPSYKLVLPENYGSNHKLLEAMTIDQWKLAKDDLAEQIEIGIQSNRNVITIANPLDRLEIPDAPPCLREMWIRHEGNRKVSIKWYFRSRDLFNAWVTNIIGIISAVQREVIIPNDCELVQIVDKCHSLHIYKGDWDSAKKVKLVTVNPMNFGRR